MVGGLISTYFGYGEVTGFNLPSFGIAVGGSFLLLFAYRILKGD
jgi:uncharacterized membrane protein YeaQ/YmgE (transglycosylase-associated protein family)